MRAAAALTLLLPPTVLLAAGPCPASAEFVVADPYYVAAVPSTPPATAAGRDGRPAAPPAAPRRPAVPLSLGFGEAVPLSFALRQIVPPRTHVVLAEGVDPDLPVDWRGGRRWDRVLAAAVAPLGLRLVAAPRGAGWVLRP